MILRDLKFQHVRLMDRLLYFSMAALRLEIVARTACISMENFPNEIINKTTTPAKFHICNRIRSEIAVTNSWSNIDLIKFKCFSCNYFQCYASARRETKLGNSIVVLLMISIRKFLLKSTLFWRKYQGKMVQTLSIY